SSKKTLLRQNATPPPCGTKTLNQRIKGSLFSRNATAVTLAIGNRKLRGQSGREEEIIVFSPRQRLPYSVSKRHYPGWQHFFLMVYLSLL
ncbi:MAG: hypothetical protein KAI39_09270, partial [Desulfobulbaceae bacterium]|nr:hypothetical protein [Desulfobulbaceae bacterium]